MAKSITKSLNSFLNFSIIYKSSKVPLFTLYEQIPVSVHHVTWQELLISDQVDGANAHKDFLC